MATLVSVIITTYRRDMDILKRSVDSVVNQTHSNIEVFIVDDNGKDTPYQKEVEKLVNGYLNENITLIIHEENQGVQRARNNGIKNAKGKYIAFLDDDDQWAPTKIEKQLNVFERRKDEQLGLVYSWYNIVKIDSDNKVEIEEVASPSYPDDQVVTELLRKNFIGSTSMPLLRKESVIDVGCFDESLPSSQDQDLWVRVAQKYKVAIVKEPLMNYFYYPGEKITNNPNSKITGLNLFYKKYQNQIENDIIAKHNYYQKIGSFQNKFGNYFEAREAFKKIVKLNVPVRLKLVAYKGIIKSYVLQIAK